VRSAVEVNTMRWIALLVCLGAACAQPASDDGEREAPLNDNAFVQKAYELARALDLYGFDPDRIECKLEVTRRHTDAIFGVETVQVSDDAHVFEFEARTGRLVNLSNVRLRSHRHDSTPPNVRLEPTLGEKQAVERAQVVLRVARPDLRDVKFFKGHYDSDQDYGGVWRLTFYREYKGYLMACDHVNVILDEEHGLDGFHAAVYSRPSAPVLKVTMRDAKRTAREKVLPRVLRDLGLDPDKTLLNVEPYWDTTCYDNPAQYTSVCPTKRAEEMEPDEAILLHQIAFVITVYRRQPELKEYFDFPVVIWIDAATGEYVCADGALPLVVQ
jgi:hypothetical protein